MSFSELPSNFVSKMNVLQNYNKAPIRVLPVSGSSPVRENGYIKFILPPGSVLDLRTISINFWGRTYHSDNTSTAKLVGFPKWTNSLIRDLDIWVNGRSVQKFPNYGFVYNVLQDYKADYAARCKQVGINADPSVYTHMDQTGVIVKHNTYVNHPTSGPINGMQGHYCWNDFIGFLASCEPSILDTNLLGSVEIHITLSPANVLFAAGLAGGDSVGFELSDLVMYVDKLDFKDERYYSMMNAILQSPARLKIPYKNYGFYTGEPITDTSGKGGTIKITEACESLDKIIFTFQDNTQPDGKQLLQLGSGNVMAPATAGALGNAGDIATYLNNNLTDGSIPATQYNYQTVLATGDDNVLNTSLFFKRNGLGLGAPLGAKNTGTVQFRVNSQDLTHPLSLLEQYQETMKAFELNEDDQKQINPGIRNINTWERDFYVCALSTSHINDKNKDQYTLVSGLDTQATSMNIAVDFKKGRDPHANQRAIPIVITEFTSHLVVSPGRQVLAIR